MSNREIKVGHKIRITRDHWTHDFSSGTICKVTQAKTCLSTGWIEVEGKSKVDGKTLYQLVEPDDYELIREEN